MPYWKCISTKTTKIATTAKMEMKTVESYSIEVERKTSTVASTETFKISGKKNKERVAKASASTEVEINMTETTKSH